MLELYLLGLFVLVLTEYGFQTRKQALTAFGENWNWRRTLLRVVIWSSVFIVARKIGSQRALIFIGIAFLLGELWAYILRRLVKSDFERGFPYARPWVHLLPFVLSGILPLALRFVPLGIERLANVWVSYAALKALAITVALVILWNWATLFTVSVLGLVRPEQIEEEIRPMIGAGEVIGILERYITFVLVSVGGFAAVGFVIAAKAAARYPQFKKREFAEYFLVGTLCSIGLAVLTSLIVGTL